MLGKPNESEELKKYKAVLEQRKRKRDDNTIVVNMDALAAIMKPLPQEREDD